MITEKQKQIIKLLLTNKEGYNVNQIARILNISVSWTHETLRLLEKESILISVKIANSVFFKLNWDNPKTEKICDLILLDERPKPGIQKPEFKEVSNQSVQASSPKNYQSFYSRALNQPAYSSSIQSRPSGNIDNPYRQAIASQSFNPVGYGTAPIGEKGVTNVLSSYAASGAFGSSNISYSSSSIGYSNTQVPAGTLGSRISSNVINYNITQHTSSHTNLVQGCKYCGPETKIF